MNPQTAPNLELIEIDWAAIPPGQVGVRPRVITLNSKLKFHQKNAGTLTLDFLGNSPFHNGATVVGPDEELTAVKLGNFPYKCKLTHPDGTTEEVDPTKGPGGGELKISPGN